MSRRTISRGARAAKPKEPVTIDPQARRRWGQRRADDMTVIEMLKTGKFDLICRRDILEVVAELGWTQGRLRAAVERVRVNA